MTITLLSTGEVLKLESPGLSDQDRLAMLARALNAQAEGQGDAASAAATAGTAVATDASAAKLADITATASFTLSNPTGGYNGKRFVWRIWNNSGEAITVTLDTAFTYGANVASFPAIAAGKVGYLAAVYRTLGGVAVWDVVAADAF